MSRWTLCTALLAFPVAAPSPVVAVPPLFVIPNEGRNPMGAVEGIEGDAFVARACGVGAICYNLAGLVLSKKNEISSSSAAYEWTFYSGEVGNVSVTSSRFGNNGRLFGFIKSFSSNGTTSSLLLVGGVPCDVNPTEKLGLAVGAPGYRLAGSSNLLVQENTSTNSGYQSLWFHDLNVSCEVRHQAWVNLGGAWRCCRGAIEMNLKTLAAVPSYDQFKTSVPGSYRQAGPAGTTVGSAVLGASSDQRRTTTNITLGGPYYMSERTSWHAGLFTANSPVVTGSTFEQIDLYGVSTGLFLRWSNLSGSVGFAYDWGNRDLKVPQAEGPIVGKGGLGIHSPHLL